MLADTVAAPGPTATLENDGMMGSVKRAILGAPLPSGETERQRLN
jgi:hypothetical protein